MVLGLRWFPCSAIGAAAALISAADQVWLYCITFRAICLADFESAEIFLLESSFSLAIKKGVSRRILLWPECNDRISENADISTV